MSQVILKRITVEELRLSYPTRATLSPHRPQIPDVRKVTFSTAGIFVVVTHATSGGRRESVTWQARLHGPAGRDEGLSGGPGAAPSGQTAPPRPPAGTGSATCPDCACAARGSAQGLPPLPGSAAASEPGVCGPAGLTPQPLRAQAGRDRRRAEETETPCLGLDTSSSRVPLLRPSAPSSRLSSWSSWLGAAVDLDDSVLP